MGRYLVVAHQTATSPDLLKRVKELTSVDPKAEFTLLVPATHPTHLLSWEREGRFVWNDHKTYDVARRKANEAEAMFRRARLQVDRTVVGDASPILAIEDEMRMRPGTYDAIVLSTLPAGRSRWLESGLGSQVSRFGLPIIHIGGEPAPEPTSKREQNPILRNITSFGRKVFAPEGQLGTAVIVVLALIYLGIGIALAVRVDNGFFLNDAMALIAFAIIIGGLMVAARRSSIR
jgi:hypothetical protein